jgi:molecular chaperone GrpE
MTHDPRVPRTPEDDRPDRPRIHVRDKRLQDRDQPAAAPREPEVAGGSNVAELQKLADDRLDQLMRLKADFENFRKRELREKTDLIERASLRIVERLLPVLDDLERALEAARTHEPEAIVRGVELVHKHLHGVLVDEGLERVESAGAFDPEQHEAVSSVAGDVPEPTVLEVVRPGYKLKGKTIRPALVHVSVPDPEQPQGGGE